MWGPFPGRLSGIFRNSTPEYTASMLVQLVQLAFGEYRNDVDGFIVQIAHNARPLPGHVFQRL